MFYKKDRGVFITPLSFTGFLYFDSCKTFNPYEFIKYLLTLGRSKESFGKSHIQKSEPEIMDFKISNVLFRGPLFVEKTNSSKNLKYGSIFDWYIFLTSSCWWREQETKIFNLTREQYSNIETGNTKLSLPTIVQIANALSVTVDKLLCDNVVFTVKFPFFAMGNQSIHDICNCRRCILQMDLREPSVGWLYFRVIATEKRETGNSRSLQPLKQSFQTYYLWNLN